MLDKSWQLENFFSTPHKSQKTKKKKKETNSRKPNRVLKRSKKVEEQGKHLLYSCHYHFLSSFSSLSWLSWIWSQCNGTCNLLLVEASNLGLCSRDSSWHGVKVSSSFEELPSLLVEATLLILSISYAERSKDDEVDVAVRSPNGVPLFLALTLLCHPWSDLLTFSDITVFLNLDPICNHMTDSNLIRMKTKKKKKKRPTKDRRGGRLKGRPV